MNNARTKTPTHSEWLHKKCEPWANAVKTVLQMILGVAIAVVLALKLLLAAKILPAYCNFLRDVLANSPLELVGKALAISAGLDLAYMLFTAGPDEAVDPIIVGFAATVLLEVSKETPLTLERSAMLLLLILCMGALFWLHGRYIKHEEDGESTRVP